MAEVPHCPECKRADCVDVRNGHGYSYWCNLCNLIIEPDDVTDGPWVDMVSESMFDDPEKVIYNADDITFDDACKCHWCLKVRDGVIDVEHWRRRVQSNAVDKFFE